MTDCFFSLILLAFLTFFGIYDLLHFKFPNPVLIGMIFCRIPFFFVWNFRWDFVIAPVILALIILSVLLFTGKDIGGGDFKLMVILAFYFGMDIAFYLIFFCLATVCTFKPLYDNSQKGAPLGPAFFFGLILFFFCKIFLTLP